MTHPHDTAERTGDSSYVASLATILSLAAIPYGMTLVVSSELLILRHYHGAPGLRSIFEFAFGAICGYAAAAFVSTRQSTDAPTPQARQLVRAGASHLVAVGITLAVGVGCAQLPAVAAWLATGALAIPSFIGLSAFQYSLHGRWRRRVVRGAARRDVEPPR